MNKREKKEPTLMLALTPVVLTVIILIFSVSVLKVDVQVPLILGTCITAIVAIGFMGYSWQDLEDGAVESLKSIMQAVQLFPVPILVTKCLPYRIPRIWPLQYQEPS